MGRSVEECVRAIAVNDPTVSGIIGDRIFPSPAPGNATVPFVAYQRISAPEGMNLDGPDLGRVRIQYSFFHENWMDAWDAREAFRTLALSSTMRGTFFGVTIDSVSVADSRDMGLDVESNLHRHDLDLEVIQQL